MPSIGAVVAMERAREADRNKENGAGFIAVHPEKGIFLGVDDNRKTVFIPVAELDLAQPVPVFMHPQYVATESTSDPSILDCEVHRVLMTDTENQTSLASDVIDFEKSVVRHNAPGSDCNEYASQGSTIFNRIVKSVGRFPSFEVRKYTPV